MIELIDVHKKFRGVEVISGVSHMFERGRAYAVVGANGAGKSVLLRLMCSLLRPSRGEIVYSRDIFSPGDSYPSATGISIDGPAYIASRSGLDNLVELASIRGEITEFEVKDWMTRLGLNPDASTPMRNYSLGMKQKVALTQALMEHPKALLLDEPFNALDSDSVKRVKSILREHVTGGGLLVFTSHDERDVDELADTTLQLSQGLVEERKRS